MIAPALKHWLPYKLLSSQDCLQCRWLYAGEKRFAEPFFDETILKCLSHPFNSKHFKVVSNMELLEPWSRAMEQVKLSAIIFHVSRCGSTLLTQLLSLMQQNIVLSEVPFLDEILRLPYQTKEVSKEKAESLFNAAITFYGQVRFSGEQQLFLKTDSWHILFYRQLRKLYPNVPFVLLYRAPDEVACSHQKKRGMHSIPNLLEPGIFGWSPGNIKELSLDVYLSRVLETYFAAYLEIASLDDNILLANYNEGIPVILNRIVDKIGLVLSDNEWEKVRERAGYDAKQPGKKFSELPGAGIDTAILQNCFELYRQLETVRLEKLKPVSDS